MIYIFLPEPNIFDIATLVCVELCLGMCPFEFSNFFENDLLLTLFASLT
jgi:hypothetical protein